MAATKTAESELKLETFLDFRSQSRNRRGGVGIAVGQFTSLVRAAESALEFRSFFWISGVGY